MFFAFRRDELIRLSKETDLTQQLLEDRDEEMRSERRLKSKLENVLSDCSKALKHALSVSTILLLLLPSRITKQDLRKKIRRKSQKNQYSPSTFLSLVNHFSPTQTSDEDPMFEVAEKRDNLLENLLVILNSAAALGVGPAMGEFSRPAKKTSVPGSGKGLRKS